jgi:hypothetical protein
MIYTVENTLRVGNVVDYIVDANGERIHGPTIECNTETGEVIQYVTYQNGVPILDVDRKHCVRRRMIFQKPLQVVFARHLTTGKR